MKNKIVAFSPQGKLLILSSSLYSLKKDSLKQDNVDEILRIIDTLQVGAFQGFGSIQVEKLHKSLNQIKELSDSLQNDIAIKFAQISTTINAGKPFQTVETEKAKTATPELNLDTPQNLEQLGEAFEESIRILRITINNFKKYGTAFDIMVDALESSINMDETSFNDCRHLLSSISREAQIIDEILLQLIIVYNKPDTSDPNKYI